MPRGKAILAGKWETCSITQPLASVVLLAKRSTKRHILGTDRAAIGHGILGNWTRKASLIEWEEEKQKQLHLSATWTMSHSAWFGCYHAVFMAGVWHPSNWDVLCLSICPCFLIGFHTIGHVNSFVLFLWAVLTFWILSRQNVQSHSLDNMKHNTVCILLESLVHCTVYFGGRCGLHF